MQGKENKKNRKTYAKPRLRKIELKADEVLAVGCKTGAPDPKGIGNYGCTNGFCSSTPGS
jgi:hypothetical protein